MKKAGKEVKVKAMMVKLKEKMTKQEVVEEKRRDAFGWKLSAIVTIFSLPVLFFKFVPVHSTKTPRLTLDEKLSLIHGALGACGYTGLTRNMSKHGIPQLRMNDGPQGFRGPPETSTSFPCGLSMAATFDSSAVEAWGKSIAEEFKAKGANVVLGPGLNILRVPENGRSFEYLSGEDPILGREMAHAAVQGIQSVPGIIATAKHFALNNQERDRSKVSVSVDDSVLNELYLPPFHSAVLAGVGSVMCSYNRINDVPACENKALLEDKLKTEWGFRGFVVSDWGGTRSTEPAVMSGLDLEMPFGVNFGANLRNLAMHNRTISRRVSQMSGRVLHAMHQAGLIGTPTPPCLRNVDATSQSRRLLARKWAASGAVLLKNSNYVLPLTASPNHRVLVFGKAAVETQIVHGGGSGKVLGGKNVVSALRGLKQTLASLMPQEEYSVLHYTSAENRSDVNSKLQSAAAAVVVVATNSREGTDRESLLFSSEDSILIGSVSFLARAAGVPVIVIAVVPGPVVVPWVDQVDALLLMFLPGQEFGNAAGLILYGLEDPGGRLPLTIPFPDKRMAFEESQYPGVNHHANYSEGFLHGYRWYDFYNVQVMFPFGFGLSYGRFSFTKATIAFAPLAKSWTVAVKVTNHSPGGAGFAVVQLYLRRLHCDKNGLQDVPRPVQQLIGFDKKLVAQGRTKELYVAFGFDQLKEWRDGQWSWPSSRCEYTLVLGTSSRHPIDEIPLPLHAVRESIYLSYSKSFLQGQSIRR